MQQPQFGAFFRDLQVSMFSNIWPLVQEKAKWTSMFKAEIPEIHTWLLDGFIRGVLEAVTATNGLVVWLELSL